MNAQQQKADWLNSMMVVATRFSDLVDFSNNLIDTWNLRGYDVNGASAVTDTEAATINCTATEIQNAVNMMMQLVNLKAGNSVVASNQYNVACQKMRRITPPPQAA